MSDPRERLAAQQQQLLAALLGHAEAPPGFDQDQLRVQQRALLNKRRRVVAKLRPELAEELGERFQPLFDSYAVEHPRRPGQRARADATRFARWITRRNRPWKRRR
ncbi:hypothetical protein [Saccharopolyspora dendranthemae]|uniref:SCO6045-like C-terminal domain-containing protein n=1 Tax=Saccharopolyspora dendranthemae TaxID=1181886 RepID=A0A561U3B0_9PSEU|nr:hypothetical protein [Saccharopolyspora dendranthemae]TWF93854.1 hypothetical protein FHU35_14127 [Saccharopolyspora dendranthemae]